MNTTYDYRNQKKLCIVIDTFIEQETICIMCLVTLKDSWILFCCCDYVTFLFIFRPWDIDRFLKQQCKRLNIQIPHYFHRWVNVRKHFYNYYKIKQVNVELMLQHLGMEFEGRPHCGIDDSRNIARILIQLKKDGADMCINETFR